MNTRRELLNAIIEQRKYKSYLEVGIYDNELNFNHINCEYKTSCDPNPNAGAIHVLTSDEFFAQNLNKFDLIFIDGLHHSDQVIKDIANALDCLNEGGTIVMHDCLPENEYMQLVPQTTQVAWTGDCWKAFVHYRRTRKDLFMFVLNFDCGCGVIIPNAKQDLLKIEESEITYDNFVKNKEQWMNLRESLDFQDY